MAKSGTEELDTVDIMAVFDHLPHRYPFLLIDKVIGIEGNRAGIGIKNVTINEPHFQGHFPDRPIMPGVLMIEGMAQTACVICVHHAGRGGNLPKVYFMSIDKARFRRPVVPGDQLEYHVEMLRVRGQVWKFACEARVDGERVAEAVITAMISDA